MTESGTCVIGSHNLLGIVQAAHRLACSCSAVEAVDLAIRPTEDNPGDHGVGYGGWPNLLGEVECDAAIMEGATLRNGAVGALRGYRHPITVARHVMERLVHVLLVGEGAERFAAEMGCERRDMLSDEA
jgi:beta-aspartyl-peptidase (threonine type)